MQPMDMHSRTTRSYASNDFSALNYKHPQNLCTTYWPKCKSNCGLRRQYSVLHLYRKCTGRPSKQSSNHDVCRSAVMSKVPLGASNACSHLNPLNATSIILEAAPATTSRHFSATSSKMVKDDETVIESAAPITPPP
jgi:hypothetical protein